MGKTSGSRKRGISNVENEILQENQVLATGAKKGRKVKKVAVLEQEEEQHLEIIVEESPAVDGVVEAVEASTDLEPAAAMDSNEIAQESTTETPQESTGQNQNQITQDQQEAPLSPKSTLLAFKPLPRTKTSGTTKQVEPTLTHQAKPTPVVESHPSVVSSLPLEEVEQPAPSSTTTATNQHQQHPQPQVSAEQQATMTASTEWYKQQLVKTRKELDLLQGLHSKLVASVTDSNVALKSYKELHQAKVDELNNTVDLLMQERESINKKLLDAPVEGISLAQYQAMVEQVSALQAQLVTKDQEHQVTKDTLELFQKESLLVKEKMTVLEEKLEGMKEENNKVVTERDLVVQQLAAQTRLVSDRNEQVNKLEENHEAMKSQKGHLESELVQAQSRLAQLESIKHSHSTADELERRLEEEVSFSSTLESIGGMYEYLTGIKTKNVESIQRTPLSDASQTSEEVEYNSFTIKQKGSLRSFTYKLLVPKEKNMKIAYVPVTVDESVPEWLCDEMEFESSMARLFFGNMFQFLNGVGGDDEDDIEQVQV